MRFACELNPAEKTPFETLALKSIGLDDGNIGMISVAELFAATGSRVAVVTSAEFVRLPSALTLVKASRVAELFGFRVPTDHVKARRLFDSVTVPWLCENETNVPAAERTSVTTTPVATSGPAFVTVMK